VTPTILSKVARQIHLQRAHPIAILRSLIEAHFAATEDGSLSTSSSSSSPHPKPFKAINALSPIVTVEKNFDELGFAADHPGRALSDSYYLNAAHMLRTHTSAHEVETFRAGTDRWLLTADVYRRDEIDASHYPVFHQMEGAHVVPRSEALRTFRDSNAALERRLSAANIVIDDPTSVGPSNPYQDSHDPAMAEEVTKNLKNTLNSLVLELFGGIANSNASVGASSEPLQIRWIEAFFPFTSPSYEVEVMFQGKWLEILGCGVVRQKTLDTAGAHCLCSSRPLSGIDAHSK
jgi:phenylalanyl-tRNA synthetase alpha chain